MKDTITKIILPILLTLITAAGAFSLKIEYNNNRHSAQQQKIGHLIVSLSKNCNK